MQETFTSKTKMKYYTFTVIKTGYVTVEAESFDDAEAILQEDLGHFYVSTNGSQEPADGWELTDDVEEN
tara:strand:- start:616 stop:822 length:207 start_codon:yes stop_codon:yes gene_type:complete